MTADEQARHRFVLALDLWATGVALRRQALRRQHPLATETALDALLAAWLQDRPGAAHGDGPPKAAR